MTESLSFIEYEMKIIQNLANLSQTTCDGHKKYRAYQFCTHPSCIKNSTSFLCQLCADTHQVTHRNQKHLKPIDYFFSVKLLSQMKDETQTDLLQDEKILDGLKQINQIFTELKDKLNQQIDETCEKMKQDIKAKYDFQGEQSKKIIREYEEMLIKLLGKDQITEVKTIIEPYLNNFNELTGFLYKQIKQSNKKTEDFDAIFSSVQDVIIKSKNLQSELFELVTEKIRKPSSNCDNQQPLFNRIKNIQFEEKRIPKLHTSGITKIISFDNHKKFITCSGDTNIIVRNKEDNQIINTLIGHQEDVRDIILLQDGRLASCSNDKLIKIWNISTNQCHQTLVGHTNLVYCLVELPNSILLSGSQDNSLRLWDLSQKDKTNIESFSIIKNDKQQQAHCLALINSNQIAVSSFKDINIYLFDDLTKKNFIMVLTLKGHTDWVRGIDLVKNSKDLLVSCSWDKDCRLWSIARASCLQIFKGHTNKVVSILVLSNKIFASAGTEIKFWDIDQVESIKTITPDDNGTLTISMIKDTEETIVFAGNHNYLGTLNM